MRPPAKDITDETRPIGARTLNDGDYRQMVESITDYAIFMMDVNGVIRSWNAGARKLKGYEASEVIGQHFSMFYPQELKDRAWPKHELEVAARDGRFEDEGWRLRKDGTRFWANIIISRLLGPAGELLGFSKITRDLTERRRQDELVRESEERFRLLVESVKDYAIFMLDPSGHVVSWNPGAEQNTGYKASEIIGRHVSVFYPQDLAATAAPAVGLEAALKDGRFEDQGWRIRKDGSRFWAGVVLSSVFDATGRHRGFAKVTRDLTETRKVSHLEDEGRRITTFLAMLGHELRNPLAPMANAIALLQRDTSHGPVAAKPAIEVIDRQVKQMTRLVDDLLDVGRITSNKIHLETKPVRVREVLEDAVEAVAPLIEAKGHRLHVTSSDTDAWVSGDRARLVQIVTNLLNNAAKFTPGGGDVEVGVGTSGAAVEIRVKDTGPGIKEEMRTRIFDLFVQGEQDSARAHGGLGLGLTIVRQLAGLHGGAVDLFSKGGAGSGSEFVVRLPAIQAPSAARKIEGHAGRKKRILVVDDNHDSADTMSLLVQSIGYDTATVYDGLAAINAVLADPPDAVLLDLGLPGLSGLEVAHRIKAQVVDPPELIAVTGYGQESDREATFKAGFFAHLSKPVRFDELSGLLKKLFA